MNSFLGNAHAFLLVFENRNLLKSISFFFWKHEKTFWKIPFFPSVCKIKLDLKRVEKYPIWVVLFLCMGYQICVHMSVLAITGLIYHCVSILCSIQILVMFIFKPKLSIFVFILGFIFHVWRRVRQLSSYINNLLKHSI